MFRKARGFWLCIALLMMVSAIAATTKQPYMFRNSNFGDTKAQVKKSETRPLTEKGDFLTTSGGIKIGGFLASIGYHFDSKGKLDYGTFTYLFKITSGRNYNESYDALEKYYRGYYEKPAGTAYLNAKGSTKYTAEQLKKPSFDTNTAVANGTVIRATYWERSRYNVGMVMKQTAVPDAKTGKSVKAVSIEVRYMQKTNEAAFLMFDLNADTAIQLLPKSSITATPLPSPTQTSEEQPSPTPTESQDTSQTPTPSPSSSSGKNEGVSIYLPMS